jgi:[calcium/calmodulin-dependent protein kinase] kinase
MDIKLGSSEHSDPPFDPWQTREYFRQLCLGVEYLHANEVIHHDVRSQHRLPDLTDISRSNQITFSSHRTDK